MIRLLAFDLDGTLVQTEKLKAESYAQAAHQLDARIAEADVIEAYADVVGRSRQEVAAALVERFGLEGIVRREVEAVGAGRAEPWQGYVDLRLRIYREMVADAETIRAHRWPHATALLRHARAYACYVALATTSERELAEQVLRALGFADAFDHTVTADDVEQTKPAPEAYLQILDVLDLAPEEGVAIEDSPAGARAAVAAGLHCIAVTTDFTRDRIEEAAREGLLDPQHIVHDPARLPDALRGLLERENGLATA